MINKYFTVEVKPTITGAQQNGNSAVFSDNDVLFDWTSFEVPKGASKLTAATLVMRGKDGAKQVEIDLDLLFAKTVNGTAPVTLGDPNLTASGLPVLTNHLVGMIHIDSAGDYGVQGLDHFSIASTGSGAAASLIPNMVLQGEPDSGSNVGFDTLYIAGLCGANSLSFGTKVLVRGAITANNTTTIPTDLEGSAGSDPNAELVFAPGDVLQTATSDNVGTISSISAFDTNHQDIILTANNVDAIADNEELFNINPIRIILSFEK